MKQVFDPFLMLLGSYATRHAQVFILKTEQESCTPLAIRVYLRTTSQFFLHNFVLKEGGTNKQTNKQASKQANKQTNKQL